MCSSKYEDIIAVLFLFACLFDSSGNDVSLLITEKVKQTVQVPDVTMDTTTQDDDLNENTELAVLVSVIVYKCCTGSHINCYSRALYSM